MNLSLVVHLGLDRGSCLNVSYMNSRLTSYSVGKPGRRRVGSEEGDTWQAGQEASLHPRQKSSQGDGSQILSWSVQLQGFFFSHLSKNLDMQA